MTVKFDTRNVRVCAAGVLCAKEKESTRDNNMQDVHETATALRKAECDAEDAKRINCA